MENSTKALLTGAVIAAIGAWASIKDKAKSQDEDDEQVSNNPNAVATRKKPNPHHTLVGSREDTPWKRFVSEEDKVRLSANDKPKKK
jgi:hypothetical protein